MTVKNYCTATTFKNTWRRTIILQDLRSQVLRPMATRQFLTDRKPLILLDLRPVTVLKSQVHRAMATKEFLKDRKTVNVLVLLPVTALRSQVHRPVVTKEVLTDRDDW
jgi:hypothetical protein